MDDALQLLERHVFLDIETTGLDASRDEIIEVGAVFVRNGVVEREASWLIRPTQPVPAVITALTGLSTEALAGAPSFEELRPQLVGLFDGATVVAHNALFEQSFLEGLLEGVPVLDSCELALILFPELRSHALDALIRWAGLGSGSRHRALADAQDTLQVVRVMLARAKAPDRRWALAQLAGRLGGGTPLHRVLLGLSRLEAPAQAEAPVESRPGPTLPEPLSRWAMSPTPLALELEVGGVEEFVVEAASRVKGSTWIVCPHARLRGLPALPRVPPREAFAAPGRLKALLSRRVVLDPTLAASMAYLESWGARAAGDVGTLSGFWRDRVPLFDLMRTLLRSPAQASPPPGVLVGALSDVMGWLEAGVTPDALIWLDAPAMPELERRRQTVSLELSRVLRLPELSDLAAPGRPLSQGQKAVHLRAQKLSVVLQRFAVPTLIDRAAPDPWLVLRDALLALGRDLSWWLSELRAAPPSPLLDGVLQEASGLAEQLHQLTHPEAGGELWASPTSVWLRPEPAAAEASLSRLAALAPSLLVSDVRRPPTWAARFGPVPLGHHGQANAPRPLAIAAQLARDEALAMAALSVPGQLTVLCAEPLTEPLVGAFVRVAAAQGRAVRLHASGAGEADVVLLEWWGLGPVPDVRGGAVLAGAGDRFAVRRLLAAGVAVEGLLLKGPFEPTAWAAPLAGLAWFETVAPAVVEAPALARVRQSSR